MPRMMKLLQKTRVLRMGSTVLCSPTDFRYSYTLPIPNPNPISERELRIHAISVRSAAKRLRSLVSSVAVLRTEEVSLIANAAYRLKA